MCFTNQLFKEKLKNFKPFIEMVLGKLSVFKGYHLSSILTSKLHLQVN